MKKKRLSAIFMALALCVSLSAATACSASDNGEKPGSGIDAPGGNTGDDGNAGGGTVHPDGGKTNKNALNKVANFSTGFTSADGGVAEIVKYNEDNGKFYLVNGKTQTLDIVTLRTLADDKTQLETVFTEETDRISFDSLAASEFKEHFNCSNDDVKLDSRSKKKGPEPESVEVAEIDGKRYAFAGLERTGGVMMFDITDFLKGKAALSAYANSRDYSLPMAGDVAPEGLEFLPAEKSLSGSIAAGKVYIIRCAAANTTSAVINVADTDDNSADFEAVSFKGEAQGSEKATTYMKKLGLE